MKAKKRITHLVFLQNLSDRLLWLEVKQEDDRLRILSGGKYSLQAPEAETETPTAPEERFRQAVGEVKKNLHVKWLTPFDTIYIAPSYRLSARFLETPPTENENIHDLVAFEVSEALQVPIDEIAWDMLISSRHGESAEKHLLWVATRKEYVDSILAEWPPQALMPTQVTADFWAIYECLLGLDESGFQEPCVIVSQEGDRATLTVANRRAIYFTRSVMLTRPQLPAKESSESAKENLLASEIERTLTYVADRFPQGSIRNMILCGFDNWEMQRISQTAESNGLAVTRLGVGEILALFQPAETIEISPDHLAMLCMAYCRLGRDIKGLNLLGEREAPVSWQSLVPEAAIPSREFMVMSGALATLIVAIWIGSHLWFNHAVTSRLKEGQDLLKLAERLQREETALREMTRNHVSFADLFLYLAEMLPAEVLVKSISLDMKTGVDLVLVGGNHQKILEIMDKLNTSPYFRELAESRAVNEKDGFTVYVKGKLKPIG